MCGLADGRATKFKQLYQKYVPDRVEPDRPRFTNVHERLTDIDTLNQTSN